jgi:hypothetical protein
VEINTDEILLDQNEKRETVYHLAAERNDEGILEVMWGFVREARGNPKEIKKKLLLLKDKTGKRVWHRAAKRGSLEELEKLWNWAKEVQIYTYELLLFKEKHEKDSSQFVTQMLRIGLFRRIGVEVKEVKMYKEELTRWLILAEDAHGKTAWHLAASLGNSRVLETLWTWANEVELNTVELLIAQNTEKYTAFQLAEENNHVETIKRMLVWAEEKQLNPNELKNKLLLT